MRIERLTLVMLTISLISGCSQEEQQSEPIAAEAPVAVIAPVVIEPTVVEEIETESEPVAEPVSEPDPTYTEDELEALALVIYCEAGADYCADETRQMVGEVVLNRIASEYYPDTIEEVLTAPYQYGRFHWTGLVWPGRASTAAEAHAVERAYACAEALLSGTIERLLPTDTIFQSEYIQGTEVVACVDGIYFCR